MYSSFSYIIFAITFIFSPCKKDENLNIPSNVKLLQGYRDRLLPAKIK